MALEPYDPCPCGQGKKFKFCCQPVFDELTAVERLLAENQPKQALVAAEKLPAEHALNPLLLRFKIAALMSLDRKEEAQECIQKSLKANPWDPFGYYYDIRWHLVYADWNITRPLVEQSLTLIGSQAPALAFQLSIEIVDQHLNHDCFMAAYRCLLDALEWARRDEELQYVMSVIRDLNRSNDIPLPFRDLYYLLALPENQPNQTEFAEAMQVAKNRHWTKAAQLFEALSEKDPHQPVLSYNAALCYAWSTDLAAAAELFGRAGDDLPDFESAVELESLAQLHELQLPEEQLPLRAYTYPVHSVSRLLSQLDHEPRLFRQPLPPQAPESQEISPAAVYLVLNRPRAEGGAIDLDSLPQVIGTVVIVDEVRETSQPAELRLQSLNATFTDADHQLVLNAAGEQLDLTPGEGRGAVPAVGGIPRDISSLNFQILPPSGLRRSDVLKLVNDYCRHVVFDKWTQLPLAALDGLTPADAARDPELHLLVCAAIYVLESIAEQAGYAVNVDELRQHLGLPAVQQYPCESLDELKKSKIQDALRIDFANAPKEVLAQAFTMLINTRRVYPLRRLVTAIVDREVTVQGADSTVICQIGFSLSMRLFDYAAAQTWCERGRQLAAGSDLIKRAEWDLNLLEIAMVTENEEQLVDVLRRCARDYFLKLPQAKLRIAQMLEVEQVDNPRVQAILSGQDLMVGAGVGEGGLWTPESTAAAGSSGKLWLPGQE